MELIDGIPVMEAATKMGLGACVRCGKPPEQQQGGAMENVRIVDGVLLGDAICIACLEAEGGHEIELKSIRWRQDGD